MNILGKAKIYIPIAALVLVGGVFLMPSNGQLLFIDPDQFVLVAEENITLEQDVQISSGSIAANNALSIQKDNITNGNIFADAITIDKDTTINGNASFNTLDIKKESQILGTQTTPISLPIANLPTIPDFSVGTQDFNFTGTANTLSSGIYRNIVLQKNSRLVLAGGVYNISKIDLKENSTIIFLAVTTLNIKDSFMTQQKVSIFPDQNLQSTDLQVNYQNKKPIQIGMSAFLSFKLLAPDALVHVGDNSTIRGQIIAEKINIGKGSVLSRKDLFFKESDSEKTVEDAGLTFIVNEIVVLFKDEATQLDAQEIADLIDGRITGFIQKSQIYKFEVQVTIAQELNDKIQAIKDSNNPLITAVIQNLIGERL